MRSPRRGSKLLCNTARARRVCKQTLFCDGDEGIDKREKMRYTNKDCEEVGEERKENA